jgi:Mg-chelatase subunit ChlD
VNQRYLFTLALAGIAGIVALASQPGVVVSPADAATATIPTSQVVVSPSQDVGNAWVELVFVLDTTGSMGGLLEGAKETIWSVVNDFSSQNPRPHVRVGLVAYRDRGDEYVTRSTDLTDDLDSVYIALTQLVAAGGGDTPESVSAALTTAVNDMAWTRDRERVYRAIYLVGDAPDKGYGDEVDPVVMAGQARQAEIHVSAIQCGDHGGAAEQFALIAAAGSGAFTAVAQNGAVERLETPMDGELERLEAALAGTALGYGSSEAKSMFRAKIQANEVSSPAVTAARLSVLSKTGGKAVTGDADLVDAVARGAVSISEIPVAELPESLQGMTLAEQQAQVFTLIGSRGEVQSQIDALVLERDQYITAQRANAAESGEMAFDRSVVSGTISDLRALGYIE